MHIKKHGCLLFLTAVAVLCAAAVYWWSGSLVSLWLRELREDDGSESERERIIQIASAFPLVRREGIVDEAASRYLKRQGYELKQIITRRYSEEALLDELEDLWAQNLQSKNYFHAGIILAFAQNLFTDKFRTRVSKEQMDTFINGLGPHLDEYVRRYWYHELLSKKRMAPETSPHSPLVFNDGLADLLAYPMP
ncbi:MAG: hypothetical protein ACO1TE_28290 [Prosthecobacter sp.]